MTARSALERSYNLTASIPEQYLTYWKHLLAGDLGESYQGAAVIEKILQHGGTTWALVAWSLFVTIGVSLLLGLISQLSPGLYRVSQGMLSVVLAVPSLVIALLLIQVFAMQLEWVPPARMETWHGWILPIVTLSLRPTSKLAQILLDELQNLRQSEHAEFLSALGFSQRQLMLQWLLKEAALPYVSYLGSILGGMLSGSVLVEILFSVGGIGVLFSESLIARDYPMMMGLVMVLGASIYVVQFLADVVLARLDPRVRMAR